MLAGGVFTGVGEWIASEPKLRPTVAGTGLKPGAMASSPEQSNPKGTFMRQDKLTTKFQEALGDAQSLALGNDNGYIEPAHLLAAMLRQDDGPRALLERAGVNVNGLMQAA